MDIPADIERLAHHLLKLADEADGMIVTAESCTGGQLSAVLTSAEGWSHCFDRGFISYTESAKQELLGVPSDLIGSDGVVSRSVAVAVAVAVAMAEGSLERSTAICALAVTGFAGPADEGEEPGLVHVACAIRDHGVGHRELHFGETDRDQIRWDSIRALLDLARNQMVARGSVISPKMN